MYGYTVNGTADVMENCPLTCKVCFPPPPIPGAGQQLVFTVSGSVSVTVSADTAIGFLDSHSAREALASAIGELAGPLSLGVEVDLIGGDEVQGINVSCSRSDCDDGTVLKLDANLPTLCAASACTSTECCTSPATCSDSVCNGDTHVPMVSPSSVCLGAECWQDECCDYRATCQSFECGGAEVMKVNPPALCQTQNCTASECCDARGTCAVTPQVTTSVAPSPSSGPSSGPTYRNDWMGCPASSHVSKTSPPSSCAGAECTTYECCDMRGTCVQTECDADLYNCDEVAPNITTPCDDSLQVLRDRNGEVCETATCQVDECCDNRGQCEAAYCENVLSTKFFIAQADTHRCWGTLCSESECCELRVACAITACDAEATWRLKSSPGLCASNSCLDDECCEWYFDGYKRTTDTHLTAAHTDTAEYDVPAAIAACDTAGGTCGGITCAVSSDAVAVAPCLLKASGSTASSNTLMSFVKTICASSNCPTATHVLKRDALLPDSCTGSGCDTAQCCDARDSCQSSDCPASHISNGNLDLCVGASCLRSECCNALDTCAASDCTDATHVAKEAPPLYCDSTSCVVDGECCEERGECVADDCGITHIIKPAFILRLMGRCAGPDCTLGECCNPRGVCAESVCSEEQVFRSLDTLPTLCAGNRCVSGECCLPRATCSAEVCGETHVLRSADDEERVELCEGDECFPDECCERRDQCGPGVYCQGATCAWSECCPFEGLWESTTVFGGDALRVFEESDGGWKVQIVSVPDIEFAFTVSFEDLVCKCEIALDMLTLATGQMSEAQDSIAWDMILNNDMWVQGQDRRLRAKAAKRNYEIRDGGIVVFPQDRRLQQQNVRVDYGIRAASAADALAITGELRELSLQDIEAAFSSALSDTPYSIGSVYMMSEPETEQIVIDSNSTLTSAAPMSSEFGTLVAMFVMVAAMS